MRALLALLLFAGPLLGQAPNGWAPIENGWAEIQVAPPTGTVTTTGTLAAGQVALVSGATSITGDAGCTWTGTGASFVATFGHGIVTGAGSVAAPSIGIGAVDTGPFILSSDYTGIMQSLGGSYAGALSHPTGLHLFSSQRIYWSTTGDPASSAKRVAISSPSAGLFLVEDGSGAPRDIHVRAAYAEPGTAGSPGLGFAGISGTGIHVGVSNELAFDTGSQRRAYIDAGATGFHLDVPLEFSGFGTYLSSNATPRLSVGSTSTAGNEGGDLGARTGYFGTSVVTPVVQLTLATPTTSGDTCTAGTFWADANYLYVCTATNTIKRAALSAF